METAGEGEGTPAHLILINTSRTGEEPMGFLHCFILLGYKQ